MQFLSTAFLLIFQTLNRVFEVYILHVIYFPLYVVVGVSEKNNSDVLVVCNAIFISDISKPAVARSELFNENRSFPQNY